MATRYQARSTGPGPAAGDGGTTDRTVLLVTRTPPPVEAHRRHPTEHGVTRPAADGLRATPPPKSGTGRFR
jgi:hypothetical protein